ncbi:MAG: GAF domain-containing protein [Myxococcales bacterium]|nr:GAF domain-containing protein [Myxococcales bacterium]
MGSVREAWFTSRSAAAIGDFFDTCEQHFEANEASARTLERMAGATSGLSVEQQGRDARDRLRAARGGDWSPFEDHLRALGARFARSGLEFAAWYSVANSFFDAIVPWMTERLGGEPRRLTDALLVLGEYMERSMALIATAYLASKDALRAEAEARHLTERSQLERVRAEAHEALAQSVARLEILSRTAHEFAEVTGDQGALLALVAERLSDHIGEGCTVRLLSEDGEWTEPGAQFHHQDRETCEAGRALLSPQRQPLGDGIARQVASTGVPVLLAQVDPAAVIAQAPPAFHPMLTRIVPTSVLALPLKARGRTIGVVSLLRGRSTSAYTVDDQRFAMDLADRAGLAIDNARLIATLEQRVAERTASLEAANRELDAFSYSVSHDLRAPLRAIDGFSGALLADYGTQLDSQAQQYLDRIRDSTKRMSTLIDDLLNLARVTGLPLERVRVDLSAIATEVIAELRRLDPARRVETHVVPELTVLADPRLVRIVLENLLGNAWKFTAKRDHTEIWVGREGSSLFVRDNGAGFDLRYADKVFRPFQRFHRSDEFEGTGIGLATVHRIIERHGGTITVETEPGRGALFRFSFGERA